MTVEFSSCHLPEKMTPLHPDQFNKLEWGLAETAPW